MADLGVAVRADEVRRNGHRPSSPRRGKAVPGGRAILGGFLVAAAVVGLFWASTRESAPSQLYVVASRAIAPGTRLTAADLNRVPLDLPPALAERAFRDGRALEGSVAIAPLSTGELVQASAVVAKPSGPTSREVSFAVPASSLSPDLETGERIDVIATFGAGGDSFSTVVVRQALIVGIARAARDDRDTTVTVALDDATEVIALVHAMQQAKLTVVRATGAAPVGPSASVFRPTASAPPTTAARS